MAAKIEKIVLWAYVIHSKQVLPDASQLSFNAFAGSQFGRRSTRRNAGGRSCCAVKLKIPLEIIGRCNDPGSLGGQDPLKCTSPFLRGDSQALRLDRRFRRSQHKRRALRGSIASNRAWIFDFPERKFFDFDERRAGLIENGDVESGDVVAGAIGAD